MGNQHLHNDGPGGGEGAETPHLELITRAALIAKRDANQLEYGIPGVDKIYQVTDPESTNPTIQAVQLRANSPNTFEPIGQALYFYPNSQVSSTDGFRILNHWIGETLRVELGEPAIALNEERVCLNLRWKNITGTNTDTLPPDDAVNWDVVTPSLANGYIEHWNEVIYNLDEDLVIYRREDIILTNISGNGTFWANNKKICQNEVWLDKTALDLYGVNTLFSFEWGVSTDCKINGIISTEACINTVDALRIEFGCVADFIGDIRAYSMYLMGASNAILEGRVSVKDAHISGSSLLDIIMYGALASCNRVRLTKSSVNYSPAAFATVSVAFGCADAIFENTDVTINAESVTMTGCEMSGVTLTVTDGKTNDFSRAIWKGTIVADIHNPQVPDSFVKLTDSHIYGETTLTIFSANVYGSNLTIDGGNSIEITSDTGVVADIYLLNTRIGKNQNPILIYCYTLINMRNAVIEGVKATDYTWVFSDYIGVHDREVRKGDGNMYAIMPEPTATAYNGATTYSIGDTVTSGTKDFIYINATSASGNAPPVSGRNAYWAEYWDSATNTYTVPQEATWAAQLFFTFVNPITIDSLLGLYDDFNHALIADSAAVTLTRTALAGSVTGDMVFNVAADFVLDSVNKKIVLCKNDADDVNYEVLRLDPT